MITKPETITLTKPHWREDALLTLSFLSALTAPWWLTIAWVIWFAFVWDWEITIHMEKPHDQG